MKSIAYTTTALAFAGVLALTSPAKADEMQVSGTDIITNVETHVITAAGDPASAFGVEKWVGAATSPGWFDAMQDTSVGFFRADPKLGRSEFHGEFFWTNSSGTMTGTYDGRGAFTMNEKTNGMKGTSEGTWEITHGSSGFANVHGHGTLKGEFDTGNSTIHWNGTITGFEKRASTQ